MPVETFERIADKLVRAEVLLLTLTGGEPLTHPDFKAILEAAKRRGFLVTLFTNACLVDDETAALLRTRRPRRVEVSVYGADAGTYESVTGVPGSYRRFRDGLDRLRAAGVPIRLKMLVTRRNAGAFRAIREWAHGEEIPFSYDVTVTPRLDGDPAPLGERIAPEDVAALQVLDEGSRSDFARRASLPFESSGKSILSCGAGTKTFHVDADGRLHPCVLWPFDPFDLLGNDIEAWPAHLAALRARHIRPDAECARCRDWTVCSNRCPGLSRLDTGESWRAAEYHCRVCRARDKLLQQDRVAESATPVTGRDAHE